MRLLVTGAGGFSGGFLADYFARSGFSVTALLRSSPENSLSTANSKPGHLDVLQSDLLDLDLPEGRYDAVIHAAATSAWHGISVQRIVADNVIALESLLRSVERARIGRFVFFSSLSVFGRISAAQVNEQTPIVNPDAYGTSKLLGEQMLEDRSACLTSLVLRLPAVIGPRSKRNWLSETLRKLQSGLPLSYFNPEARFNNAAHIYDIAKFIAERLRQDWDRNYTCVLGAAGQTSVADVVGRIARGTHSRSEIHIAESNQPSFWIDSTHAQSLGYRPQHIEAMIDRFIEENRETGASDRIDQK